MSETIAPLRTAVMSPTDRQALVDEIREEFQVALARKESRVQPIRLMSIDDIYRFAHTASASTFLPPSYRTREGVKIEDVVLAIQMGSELGLPPMQAIQNIACINGRPSVFGDAMPGLCRASGKVEYIKEWWGGDGETLVWFCESKRRDDPHPITRSYSVDDAKRAGLWKKAGPWTTNPGRMLMWRARGFCLRDAYPDVLRGLMSAEEAMDTPAEAYAGITIDQQQPSAQYPQPSTSAPPSRPAAVQPVAAPTAATWEARAGLALDGEANRSEWLKTLKAVLADTQTAGELQAVQSFQSVRVARSKGKDGFPSLLQGQIDDLFREAADRLSQMEEEVTEQPEKQPVVEPGETLVTTVPEQEKAPGTKPPEVTTDILPEGYDPSDVADDPDMVMAVKFINEARTQAAYDEILERPRAKAWIERMSKDRQDIQTMLEKATMARLKTKPAKAAGR